MISLLIRKVELHLVQVILIDSFVLSVVSFLFYRGPVDIIVSTQF